MSKPIPTSRRSIKKRIFAGLKKAFPGFAVEVRRIPGKWHWWSNHDGSQESYLTGMWQGRVYPKGKSWFDNVIQSVHANDIVPEMIEMDRKAPFNASAYHLSILGAKEQQHGEQPRG